MKERGALNPNNICYRFLRFSHAGRDGTFFLYLSYLAGLSGEVGRGQWAIQQSIDVAPESAWNWQATPECGEREMPCTTWLVSGSAWRKKPKSKSARHEKRRNRHDNRA
jgi:hypothetical protein